MRSPVFDKSRFAAAVLVLALGAASCSGNNQPGLDAGSAALPATAEFLPPAAAGEQSNVGPPSAGLPSLPALADLPLSPRGGSYVEADLVKTGEQYDQTLPSARVHVFNAPELNFMPNWQGESNGLQSTAYAAFHFTAPGYDRNGQVFFEWAQNPLDPYLIWIGLSDWSKGGWKWFQHQPGGYIDTGDLKPFFNAGGDMYMVIVTEGFFQNDLQEIRLGLPAPIIQWTATPQIGTAPLLVSFDASQSLPPLGLIEKYEWDPEGDGSFVEGDINGLFEFSYEEAGVFDAAVRVTNSVGSSSVASLPITVHKNWMHTYGRSGIDELVSAAVDTDGSIYLCGHSANPDKAQTYELLVQKLDSAGSLQWARRYSAADDVFAGDVAVNSSGELIVVGSQEVSGQGRECLVQKWSPEGLLLWSKTFGSANFDRLDALKCSGDEIYACGQSNSDICVLHLTSAGSLDWVRTRDGGTSDFANDLVLKNSITGDLTGLSVIGSRSVSSVQNVLRLDYSEAGNFQAARTLGNASVAKKGQAISFSSNFINFTNTYTISGTVTVGGEQQPFVLVFEGSDSSTYGVRLSGSGFSEANSFFSDGAGGYYLGGWFSAAENHGALLHLDNQGQLLSALQLGSTGSKTRSYGIQAYQEGLLTWGNALDASQTLEPLSLTAQPYSETWEDASTSGASQSWSATDSLGDSFNFEDELTLDSGAGLEDGMAAYVPLP